MWTSKIAGSSATSIGPRTSVRRLTLRARLFAATALFIVAAAVVVTLASASSITEIRVDSYQLTADPRQVVANVTVGLSYEITEHSARESPTTVTLTVRARRPGGSWPSIGIFVPVPITLSNDLGERTVIDSFGTVVPQHGTYRAP
jgi:hypothetical protein